MAESFAGKLLVASPKLVDPNFARTVVLLLAHDGEGAFGVVLNRPLEFDLAGPMAPWSAVASPPERIYQGGPVEPSAALGLARWLSPAAAPAAWSEMSAGFGVIDLNADPDDLPLDDLDGFRLFAGYAGWSAQQLEGEIDEEAWFVVDALPGDAFDPDPEHLWRNVLRRQPGKLAMFAYFPVTPNLN
ncbi:MAG: YqgE/AlgH family protein [Dehalococcoidia bacterium]|nr:YqgE/AlgH family protein [Dehalococcoidia bacterium]